MNTAHKIDPLQKKTIGLVQSFSIPCLCLSYVKTYLKQDADRQAQTIRTYALRNGIPIDSIITVRFPVSHRVKNKKPVFRVLFRIENAISSEKLRAGTVLISDAGRLGMSRAEVMSVARRLVLHRKMQVIVCDKDLRIAPCDASGSVEAVDHVASLAEDANAPRRKFFQQLIRTASHKDPGRPKGSVKHKLDRKRKEIEKYLQLGFSKTDIARVVGVARPSLVYFINARGLQGESADKGRI